MSCGEDSPVRPERFETFVNDVEMETSSSQEELELGFCVCHGLVFHEDREVELYSHQLLGVVEEVAMELSVHSSAILSLSLSLSKRGGR